MFVSFAILLIGFYYFFMRKREPSPAEKAPFFALFLIFL